MSEGTYREEGGVGIIVGIRYLYKATVNAIFREDDLVTRSLSYQRLVCFLCWNRRHGGYKINQTIVALFRGAR